MQLTTLPTEQIHRLAGVHTHREFTGAGGAIGDDQIDLTQASCRFAQGSCR